MRPDKTLVTVLINNYNYGRFLRQAIDSALHQTWRRTEIVVVDDGSTDDSADIIKSYGHSVIPVLKENGGQGSAFNAGFAASRGEIICFLDSDDVFLLQKVEKVVQAWQKKPNAGLIYHQLLFIDKSGSQIGKRWPKSVLQGELKARVQRSGGWWPVPTTSGISCSREYLDSIFPMPTEDYRLCADAYIGGIAPFNGPIIGISEPLAFYRLHDANNHNGSVEMQSEGRRRLRRYELEFKGLKAALPECIGCEAEISLDDHYPYQMCRWIAGEPVSKMKVLATAWRTASLPAAMKCRELLKAALISRNI